MASLYCCRMVTPGFVASRIDWQLWHTTLTAWPNVRTAVAAPQFGQLTERTLTGGRAWPSATSPALERPDVLQPQRLEVRRLADIERRRFVAVIESGEIRAFGPQVDEGDLVLVPIFERELAFQARVVREGPRHDGEGPVVPDERSPERGLRQSRDAKAVREKRNGERVLCVRQPPVGAAVQDDAPLVPGALIVS